jgi:hypothetical protein
MMWRATSGRPYAQMKETGTKLSDSQTLKKMGESMKAGAAVSYSAMKTGGAVIGNNHSTDTASTIRVRTSVLGVY